MPPGRRVQSVQLIQYLHNAVFIVRNIQDHIRFAPEHIPTALRPVIFLPAPGQGRTADGSRRKPFSRSTSTADSTVHRFLIGMIQ